MGDLERWGTWKDGELGKMGTWKNLVPPKLGGRRGAEAKFGGGG